MTAKKINLDHGNKIQVQKKDDRISFEEFLPIFQAVSSKKITDTADDFIEGLRHFDKVSHYLTENQLSFDIWTLLGREWVDVKC